MYGHKSLNRNTLCYLYFTKKGGGVSKAYDLEVYVSIAGGLSSERGEKVLYKTRGRKKESYVAVLRLVVVKVLLLSVYVCGESLRVNVLQMKGKRPETCLMNSTLVVLSKTF